MNGRTLIVAAMGVSIFSFGAHAQFIGDAIAAAGGSMTEQQAVEIIGSVRGVSTPKAGSTMQSSAPQGASVQDPSAVGKDVGLKRPTSTAGSTSAPPVASSASSGSSAARGTTSMAQPQIGGSTGFAGARLQAESTDPAELAEWQAAMRPVGTRVSTLSPSAETVSWRGHAYQYDKGVFYEKKGSSYVAVPAPIGAAVSAKPLGASTVFAGGKPHIYYYGTFYVYDGMERAYIVVAPPAGALVDYLPDGAKKVEWQGETHYSYAGSYYKPYYRGTSLVFVVAGQA